MLQQQTLWPGSQCASSHRRGSDACVTLVEILVVERAHLLLHQVQPGVATKALFEQWRPVPAGTTEQTSGCHLKRLRSLCWTLLSLPSLGILQPPRLVSSQKVWLGATASGNDSLGNDTGAGR